MEYEQISVSVKRLDGELDQIEGYAASSRRFLKIDTQGFDDQVLAGAENCLSDFIGVQLECSLSPLYEGQWVLEDALYYLRDRGFVPWSMRRGFAKRHREYELDVVFFREDKIG